MERKKRKTSDLVNEVKKEIKKPVEKKKKTDKTMIVSTGCTILDLALTDFLGGYVLGSVVQIIGPDSGSKTLLALSLMAEANRNKNTKNHNLYYAEPEAAMHFDLKGMFGKGMKKVKFIPEDREKMPQMTVQDWHNDLLEKCKPPYIYVLDSFDALTCEDDLKQVGAPTKGGYHTEKSIVSSSTFPKVVGKIEATNSLLVWISQERANLGPGFNTKTFSGGNAIKFYRAHEIWTTKGAKITKEIRGKDEEIGRWIHVKVGKNKETGKIKKIKFPVYYDARIGGIDDLQASIEWLIERKFWSRSNAWINTNGDLGLNKKVMLKNLIILIEKDDREQELKEIVADCWRIVEEEATTVFDGRKKKYE